MRNKLIEKLMDLKTWLFGIGIGSLALILWWIIKLIVCLTTGICIIF